MDCYAARGTSYGAIVGHQLVASAEQLNSILPTDAASFADNNGSGTIQHNHASSCKHISRHRASDRGVTARCERNANWGRRDVAICGHKQRGIHGIRNARDIEGAAGGVDQIICHGSAPAQ